MGLAKGAVKVLLKELSRRPFKGRVLTLGRQDIHFSYEQLQEIASDFNVRLSAWNNISLSRKPDFAAKKFISDDCLFKSLGFSELKTLDFSDYESADYIFDLNASKIDGHLSEAFDVIIDGGTIEHIFHIPNALNNIYKMLRQDGRIIHISPSSNYIDHGFYMFSPTLFWDFYTANRFEINNFQLFRHTRRHDIDPWDIYNYQPGILDQLGVSFGGLDDGMYSIICIATKTKESTGDIIPQQGAYVNEVWKTGNGLRRQTDALETCAPHNILSRYQMIKNRIRRVPFLYHILLKFAEPLRGVRQKFFSIKTPPKISGLKVVARY